MSSAALIPVLGIAVFTFGLPVFGLFWLAAGRTLRFSLGPPTWADQVFGAFIWTAIGTVVGVGVGVLLNSLRASPVVDARQSSLPQPRVRSDILGAAFAAFLALGGAQVASWLGVFARHVDRQRDAILASETAPKLPAALVIAIVALLPHLLLPHLVMSGNDLLDSALRRTGPKTPV